MHHSQSAIYIDTAGSAVSPTPPHQLTHRQLTELFGPNLANTIIEQRTMIRPQSLRLVFAPAVCDWLYSRHMAPAAPKPLESWLEIGLWNEIIKISAPAAKKYLFQYRELGDDES